MLEQLDDEATGIADAVAAVPGDQWTAPPRRRRRIGDRARRGPGGREVGHDQLGAVERTLAALRR